MTSAVNSKIFQKQSRKSQQSL